MAEFGGALKENPTTGKGDSVEAKAARVEVTTGVENTKGADPPDVTARLAQGIADRPAEPEVASPSATTEETTPPEQTSTSKGAGSVIDSLKGIIYPAGAHYINDERFIQDLDQLKDIRSFFIQEAISMSETRALSFGELNLLRFSPNGRPPTADEWSKIEEFTRILFASLTESLRRKYRLAGIPWIVAVLPVCFIVLALTSMIFAILGTQGPILGFGSAGANVLPFYLVWLISLGAIGAVAFIGMNALSVQEDITFDLTNRRLMILRVVLGGLFGLVLTLPFGFQEFLNFCESIGRASPNISISKIAVEAGQTGSRGSVAWQAVTLLSPFVLGFSTSLVILILNQLVDGIQAFFGKRSTTVSADRAIVSSDVKIGPLRKS